MDPAQLSDDQLDDLATKLAPRLPTGTHGDRVILSRRQFAAAATGTLGAGALMALGVDPASAQAAGQVGTASEPVDAYAYDLNVANGVTSSLAMNGNDIENAGTVSTDETIINTISADATSPTRFVNSDNVFEEAATVSAVADNSTVDVMSNAASPSAAELTIMGADGIDAIFYDTLIMGSNRIVNETKTDLRGTPPTRTYSRDGQNTEIQIDGVGETFSVVATHKGAEF
ncbi:hypothetical protein DQW50_16210 [Halorubrum sp. 48-1-W]|uniref:hypothetical protein n=1 Tax=Halorubrum sp. 48-1-W TaxID=2249761 RepID=UPI000DCCA303|nr:hypothetical protein [Halorubrum sp. 48-1-W]RAW44067.1 hypothetical protein DQW50_16210 [Halorubrum sp. 48-1-W]